jgi:hypothetical protein
VPPEVGSFHRFRPWNARDARHDISAVAEDGTWSAIDCPRADTALFPSLLNADSIAEKLVHCRRQNSVDQDNRKELRGQEPLSVQ